MSQSDRITFIVKQLKNPIFVDYVSTLFTQIVILFSSFLILRLIADKVGSVGVGEYTLLFRVVRWLYPIAMFGTTIGLPRYLARSLDDRKEITALIISSILIVSVNLTILLIVLQVISPEILAGVLFGKRTLAELIPATRLLLIATVLSAWLYSYFRGLIRIHRSNIVQLLSKTIVPLGAIGYFTVVSASQIVSTIGIGNIIISALLMIWPLWYLVSTRDSASINTGDVLESVRIMLRYGAARFAGGLLYGGLLALGPVIVANRATVIESGYFSIAQNILVNVSIAVQPLGIALLPRLSRALVHKDPTWIQNKVKQGVSLIFVAVFYLCIHLNVFSDDFIFLWLGSEYDPAVILLRILLLSGAVFVMFIILRSVIDAATAAPVIPLILGFTFIIYVIGLLPLWFLKDTLLQNNIRPSVVVAVALSITLLFLGGATYYKASQILGGPLLDRPFLLTAIGYTLVTAAMGFMMSWYNFSPWVRLVMELIFAWGLIFFIVKSKLLQFLTEKSGLESV